MFSPAFIGRTNEIWLNPEGNLPTVETQSQGKELSFQVPDIEGLPFPAHPQMHYRSLSTGHNGD